MPDEDLFSGPKPTDTVPGEPTPGNSGEPTGNPGENSYLDQMVGDGKKFKTNEDLARGKFESDRFIQKLTTELEETREELQKRLTAEDVLDKIEDRARQMQQPKPTEPSEPGESNEGEGRPSVSVDDIQKIVENTFDKKQSIAEQRVNMQTVKNTLIEKLGVNYAGQVEEKLAQLGLGKDFANGLAATQPKAFLELVGVNSAAPAPSPTQAPASGVRMENQGGDVRNFAHYEKIRKEDPQKYFSKDVQMQMHKDAITQGETFYN